MEKVKIKRGREHVIRFIF